VRYHLTAAALGAGWFPVLLVPGMTREYLTSDPWWNVAFLVAASVIVAAALRGYIGRASGLGAHLLRAATVPYAGCLVFLCLSAALLWARTLVFGGLANLHDTLSLFAMGMTAAVLCCLVVVPYGLVCQVVMAALARQEG